MEVDVDSILASINAAAQNLAAPQASVDYIYSSAPTAAAPLPTPSPAPPLAPVVTRTQYLDIQAELDAELGITRPTPPPAPAAPVPAPVPAPVSSVPPVPPLALPVRPRSRQPRSRQPSVKDASPRSLASPRDSPRAAPRYVPPEQVQACLAAIAQETATLEAAAAAAAAAVAAARTPRSPTSDDDEFMAAEIARVRCSLRAARATNCALGDTNERLRVRAARLSEQVEDLTSTEDIGELISRKAALENQLKSAWQASIDGPQITALQEQIQRSSKLRVVFQRELDRASASLAASLAEEEALMTEVEAAKKALAETEQATGIVLSAGVCPPTPPPARALACTVSPKHLLPLTHTLPPTALTLPRPAPAAAALTVRRRGAVLDDFVPDLSNDLANQAMVVVPRVETTPPQRGAEQQRPRTPEARPRRTARRPPQTRGEHLRTSSEHVRSFSEQIRTPTPVPNTPARTRTPTPTPQPTRMATPQPQTPSQPLQPQPLQRSRSASIAGSVVSSSGSYGDSYGESEASQVPPLALALENLDNSDSARASPRSARRASILAQALANGMGSSVLDNAAEVVAEMDDSA